MPSPRALFMLGPALARVMPMPAQIAVWRRQIKDVFHIEEFPYATFRGLGVALCVMGAVEVAFVQPIRDDKKQKKQLQEFITRSHYEKLFRQQEAAASVEAS